MNAIMDVVGPDDDIEIMGQQFEAWAKFRKPTMSFEQFIQIQTPLRSNAWAYEANRKGVSLIVV